MTAALEGEEWSATRPGRTLPPGKNPVPISQKARICQVVMKKQENPKSGYSISRV